MTTWLSARAVFAHVLAHEVLPDAATKKLTDSLRMLAIPARAGLVTWDGVQTSDRLLPQEFWSKPGAGISFHVNYETGEATSVWSSFVGGEPPFSRRTAIGVEFSARHVYAIWPARNASDGQRSDNLTCRQRGPKPLTLERVKTEMRAFDRILLGDMTEEAMRAQFQASRDTCRRARNEVVAERK